MNRWLWRHLIIRAILIITPAILSIFLMRYLLLEARRWYSRSQFEGEVTEWSTEHFRFFSRKFTHQREISEFVENYYRAFMDQYGNNFGIRNFHKIKPEIHIYGDRQELLLYYKKRYNADLPHNAAFYEPQYHQIAVYWNPKYQNPDHLQSILYHELIHLFMDIGMEYYPQWSRWFSEGVACYFERCKLVSGKLEVGPMDEEVRNFLKDRGLMPLPELLRATTNDFQSKNNESYYYQSYFLVYFLLHAEEGQYKSRFYEYLHEESKIGTCAPEVFWTIMGEQPPIPPQKSKLYQKCYHFLLSSEE